SDGGGWISGVRFWSSRGLFHRRCLSTIGRATWRRFCWLPGLGERTKCALESLTFGIPMRSDSTPHADSRPRAAPSFALVCVTLAALTLLGGCERLALGSAVSAYAMERYEMPALENVDRVEVAVWKKTFIPGFSDSQVSDEPKARRVTSTISSPSE